MARRRQSAAVIREVKTAVRARDGFRCVKCGMSESDHLDIYGQIHDVHRKTPGSPYTAADCVTLCRSCHGPEPISPRGSIDRSRGFTILLDIEHSEALLRFVAAQRVKPLALPRRKHALSGQRVGVSHRPPPLTVGSRSSNPAALRWPPPPRRTATSDTSTPPSWLRSDHCRNPSARSK